MAEQKKTLNEICALFHFGTPEMLYLARVSRLGNERFNRLLLDKQPISPIAAHDLLVAIYLLTGTAFNLDIVDIPMH